jgi:hypothetical protein
VGNTLHQPIPEDSDATDTGAVWTLRSTFTKLSGGLCPSRLSQKTPYPDLCAAPVPS